jgi:hypothetical protein
MKGKALREMDLCRLGLVVLHPVDTMTHSRLCARDGAGREQQLVVHEQIFPQPVVNGIPGAMTEPFSGLSIEREDLGILNFAFEGDLFELEDQRNWGDASFKTYCTPLRLGFPRRIEAGTMIEHSVEVTFEPTTSKATKPRPVQRVGTLPRLARKWPSTPGDLGFEIEVGVDADRPPTPDVFKSLSALNGRVARVVMYGKGSAPPSATAIDCWQETLNHISRIPVFTGVRGYFVEFNRAQPLDTTASGLAFPLTATVHADDAETIASNVPTIVSMANTARRITGLDRVVVSPLALYHPGAGKSRFPKELIRPWLVAMLIHSAVARIESVTLSEDILSAINLADRTSKALVSRLLDSAGLLVALVETNQSRDLHVARLGASGNQLLAANLSPQATNWAQVEIPGFSVAWIDGENVVHF